MSKEKLIDLDKEQLGLIEAILNRYLPDKTVWAYGSRVTWKAGETSDLDLAVFGCDSMEIFDLKEALEESDLLISVDVMDWESIPEKFKENIRKKYVVLQEKRELEGWREVTLGEICSDISYGYTTSARSEPIGPKFLRITDIVPHRINWENVPYCEISEKDKEKYKLEIGDIVIARTGATTGYNKIIKINSNAVFASYLIRYKINPSSAYPFYIGHILQSSYWRSFVEGVIGGSAQPGANAKQFASFVIFLPPLSEQRTIAEVLSSLDDKIDLLHRQNKTLEDMAQTLFRKWFVENPKENWGEKSLDEIANYLNGLACQKYPPENEIDRLPVLKIKELRNGFIKDSDWVTSKVNKKYIVNFSDVIFSWSGSLILKIWDGQKCVLNQHLFKVTSEHYPKWFYYFWTKHHLEKFIGIAKSKATTMGHIKKGDLSNSLVLIPTRDELLKMNENIVPVYEKLILNSKQISNLECFRDTLLPKLIGAQIRVMFE